MHEERIDFGGRICGHTDIFRKLKFLYILRVGIWRFGDELQSLLQRMRRNGANLVNILPPQWSIGNSLSRLSSYLNPYLRL